MMDTREQIDNPKLLSLDKAVLRRRELRASGKTLAITNGCFDLLHAGHVHYLKQAVCQGDELWLLMNSDNSVKSLKGPSRPVQSQEYRAYVMGALSCIDAIVIFDRPRLVHEILLLEPDVYVKAGDYSIESINSEEKAALLKVGADIRFLPFLKGFSSSELMKKITNSTRG